MHYCIAKMQNVFNKSTLYKWHSLDYKVFLADVIIPVTSRRCQYFAKMTHSLTINERKMFWNRHRVVIFHLKYNKIWGQGQFWCLPYPVLSLKRIYYFTSFFSMKTTWPSSYTRRGSTPRDTVYSWQWSPKPSKVGLSNWTIQRRSL